MLLQVGGEFTDTVMLNHMKVGSRVVVVGAISVYNAQDQDPPKGETGLINCKPNQNLW